MKLGANLRGAPLYLSDNAIWYPEKCLNNVREKKMFVVGIEVLNNFGPVCAACERNLSAFVAYAE